MQLNRQTVLLLVLLAVLAIVLYQYVGSSPGRTQLAGLQSESPLADLGTMPPSILSFREASQNRPSPPSGGRNLFGFGVPKRVVPLPASRRKPRLQPVLKNTRKKPVVVKPSPHTVPPPVAVAAALPTPPAINFVFLGYLGPENALIGVFNVTTPDGDEIVLAGVGEVIEDKFRVNRIGYEEVEIGYTQEAFSEQKKTLLMGGQS